MHTCGLYIAIYVMCFLLFPCTLLFVTGSDKANLIVTKHIMVYNLFCVCYAYSVNFTEFYWYFAYITKLMLNIMFRKRLKFHEVIKLVLSDLVTFNMIT